MRRSLLVWVVLLAGCGGSDGGEGGDGGGGGGDGGAARINKLSLRSQTASLSIGGTPVKWVRLTATDGAGNPVLGPAEEPYDQDVTFTGFPDGARRVELAFLRGQGYPIGVHSTTVDFPADDDGHIVLSDVVPMALPPKTTLTVAIVNRSAYDDSEVFIAINGKDRSKNAFYFLSFDGAKATAKPFGALSGYASYSKRLSELTREPGEHSYSFQCPREHLVSGRIYVSFGAQLQGIGLNDPAQPLSLQLPSPTGAPDHDKLWEFMELSATIPDDVNAPQIYTLYANTSVVDFFSMGLNLSMEVKGAQAPQTVGFVDGARAKVLADFAAATTPMAFRNYVNAGGSISSTQGQVLRVLAPVQKVALDPMGPLSTFLDSTIAAAWTHYATTKLDIPDNLAARAYGYKYTAELVSGGVLKMTCTSAPPGDSASVGEIYRLPRPSSRIAYDCDDPSTNAANDTWANRGSEGHKRLASLILTAINRGVLDDYSAWGTPARFYARPDGKYNHYPAILHRHALDHKVYGFGYDDIYGQDPTLASPLDDVNQVVITIPSVQKITN